MEELIHLISDPNLVYVLLSFGSLCLLAEVFHPGAILPGITGAICLILAFIGLSNLTFSWLGLSLLTLASLLFVVEVLGGLNGLFSLAAVVVFVTGSFLLFDTPKPGLASLTVNPLLIGVMTGLIASFFVYVIKVVRQSRLGQTQPLNGLGNLNKSQARTLTRLNPRGKVTFEGEVWTAEVESIAGVTPYSVEAGEFVEITGVAGAIFKVRRLPLSDFETDTGEWSQTGWSQKQKHNK